ncbi:hypothetical protein RA19_14135 [Leisingera sp. ANG-M1]|uniref:hypothetical protein n=1 Tax=Leisingera sp. ANG-M1 TaxID=1577895 RepID=UPI00057D8190|nr:hypothetical protein [Leisingera sp. ANG-M1]KIC09891.1 hypothetical protein RA19_14135 [Leisingera sp. ANG-M1]
MQRFKSWAEIDPTEAEEKLMQMAMAGEFCNCGPESQTPPEPADWSSLPADRHIRADVLRFFLRGGCESSQVTEVGVMLTGALISGELDLADCEILGNMLLHNCCFQHGIDASRCNALKDFRLHACKLPFLDAAGLKVGGQLGCDGAEFQNKGGTALNLQDAEIGQTLFLRSVKIFGAADLNGLKTGGALECNGAEFQNRGRTALNLQDAEIGQGFFFRDQVTVQGSIDLTTAHCGDLVDDPDCWPDSGHLILDGFTYRRIAGSTDARTRLNWLARGDHWEGEFYPQPYKQLAKVLHEMGHEADAKEVRISLAQKLARNARAERIWFTGTEFEFLRVLLPLPIIWFWHMALNFLTDYGYRPGKSLAALVFLWAVAIYPAHKAWKEGSFAPNSGPMLTSPEWQHLARDSDNPSKEWSSTVPGKDWETFNRYAYAADLVVPIIDLGQTDAWAPSTERGWWGYHLWWLRWVFTTMGWIVTALGAAALTGIIRRE